VSSLWLGIPTEAWELLDPAVSEALRERRLDPEELHELAGWIGAGAAADEGEGPQLPPEAAV
jgi:hypothetical protein